MSTDVPGRPDGAQAPPRGLLGIGAAILSTHAVVVGLAIPVVVTDEGTTPAVGVSVLAAIAILDIVAAALLRRAPVLAVALGTGLMVATIVSGVLSAFLIFLGVLFAALWLGWLAMRRAYATGRARGPADGDR